MLKVVVVIRPAHLESPGRDSLTIEGYPIPIISDFLRQGPGVLTKSSSELCVCEGLRSTALKSNGLILSLI